MFFEDRFFIFSSVGNRLPPIGPKFSSMKGSDMKALKMIVCLVALFGLMGIQQVSAVEVAGNPGFEIAGTGGATDSDLWSEFAGGAAGTVSERDASMPASGNWAHHLLAIGNSTTGASAGINQNSIADVGLDSLEENTTLDASFLWKADLGPGGVAFAALRVLDGVGAVVADSGLQPLPASANYTPITLPTVNVPAFGAAPADTYAAFLEISVGAGAFDGSRAEGYVDDVSIQGTLVPEPASLALIGLGGLAMLSRRRRSA
ncbi:MAG: PEP-CTERM sorting domain-containing protein [Rhodospirillales bacterium]|nr:PEP-CTERM sorting domain-containing protein [Rhodospirillales bacterium]